MKFCKDCKYSSYKGFCTHPSALLVHTDLVWGHMYGNKLCNIHRKEGACGLDAKYFSPSLLYKLFTQ